MRRKRTDHSGLPKNQLSAVPKLELVLYHWSPTSNRRNIERIGLDIYRRSLQEDFRAPYVAFSDEPNLAWALSGRMWPRIRSWDLWMCYYDAQTSFDGYEIITDTYRETGRHFVKEYRVYSRVYKRDLIYVATRKQ